VPVQALQALLLLLLALLVPKTKEARPAAGLLVIYDLSIAVRSVGRRVLSCRNAVS